MIDFFKQSFKRELFVSFVIVACVPLLITGFSLVYVFRNWVMHQDEKKAEQQLQQIESSLTSFFGQVQDISDQILANDVIMMGMHQQDAFEKNKAYMAFYGETAPLRNKCAFGIYDQEGSCQFSTSAVLQSERRLTYWGIFKRARLRPEQMVFEKLEAGQSASQTGLEGVKAITNEEEECIGYIVVTISGDGFSNMLQGTYEDTNGLVILNRFWEEVYSSKNGTAQAALFRNARLEGTGQSGQLKDILYRIKPLEAMDLYVILYKHAIFTEDFTHMMRFVLGMMTLSSIIWCIFAVAIVSGNVTRPIHYLADAMHEVENGNLKVRVKNERKDEIGQLTRSFDKMTEEIDQHIKLQVRQQRQLNESRVALMQAQLNPHFLYNTLDTMKWVAKANHIPELEILASGLAKILRTSISGEQFIPLARELQLVEAYIEIQKVRFSGKFDDDVEVEPELEDCLVPKLIIQPIVENAVVHGLRDASHGHIFLNVYKQEGDMVIDVYDDGCGIDEDMLTALNTHDAQKLKGHIGFEHVDAIIRLNYGEGYGLRAEKQKTGGTKIRMCLPIIKEGKQDV